MKANKAASGGSRRANTLSSYAYSLANPADVVDAFRHLHSKDRHALATQLNAISSTLMQDIKFQPKLFEDYIRIRTGTFNCAERIQQVLLNWGCGWFNGTYPLSNRPQTVVDAYGIGITPTGSLSLWMNHGVDVREFDRSDRVLVPPEIILDAASIADVQAFVAKRVKVLSLT